VIEIHVYVGQEGDLGTFLWCWCNSVWWVEGLSDLSVTVAVLPEGGPQKLQFSMQALLITKGSGPVHQHGVYSLLVGRMVVRIGVEVEISVCV
jgi:hypothetical protein